MTDNCTVAILSKVNELAERYGLKPYEFITTYREHNNDAAGNSATVSFESGPAEDRSLANWEKMLQDLGATGGELRGTERSVYEALESAIQRAPRTRGGWDRFSSN